MNSSKLPRSTSVFRRARRGAGLVEYGVIVGLIAVVAVGAVMSTGEEVEATFETTSSEVEIARLMATAERRITLADGTKFPAQSCLIGTSGAETVASGDGGAGDINDCYDMKGGGDTLNLDSGPARNILTYVAGGSNETFFPSGNHLILFGSGGSGYDKFTFAGGASNFVASQFNLADLEVTPQSARLRVENGAAGVDMLNVFTADAPVGDFHFADVVMSFDEMKTYAVSSQASSNNDVIFGTALNDIIIPLAGYDFIRPFEGDDRIVYEQGDKTLLGGAPVATGFDILDLTKYTSVQVSLVNSFGTIEVTTPDGTIEIWDANGSPTNIERIEFSDGNLDYADFPTP